MCEESGGIQQEAKPDFLKTNMYLNSKNSVPLKFYFMAPNGNFLSLV